MYVVVLVIDFREQIYSCVTATLRSLCEKDSLILIPHRMFGLAGYVLVYFNHLVSFSKSSFLGLTLDHLNLNHSGWDSSDSNVPPRQRSTAGVAQSVVCGPQQQQLRI